MYNIDEITEIIYDNFMNEGTEEEQIEKFVRIIRNCVNYSLNNNHTKTNYIAQDLFNDIVDEETLATLFDES